MQSKPSQAGLVLSKNSFYSAVIRPLGFYHLGGMKSPTYPRIKIPFPNSAVSAFGLPVGQSVQASGFGADKMRAAAHLP